MAETRLEKQLDLTKFIQRQRMQMYATLMAINPQKALILEKMGVMTVQESSDLGDSSSNEADNLAPQFLTESLKNVSKEIQNLYKMERSSKKKEDFPITSGLRKAELYEIKQPNLIALNIDSQINFISFKGRGGRKATAPAQ